MPIRAAVARTIAARTIAAITTVARIIIAGPYIETEPGPAMPPIPSPMSGFDDISAIFRNAVAQGMSEGGCLGARNAGSETE
jgi:hypothetical protein